MQQSSICYFYRKLVFYICCILCTCCPLSHPLSGRSGVQKVCRAKISPLKQASVFMQSRENGRVRTQNGSCNLACLAQTSNVHQQLRFLAGIWTTAISYKSKAALSMWTFLGGNTQRVHFFILSTAPPSGLYSCFEIYLAAKP